MEVTGVCVRGAEVTGVCVRGAEVIGVCVRVTEPTGVCVRVTEPTGVCVRVTEPTGVCAQGCRAHRGVAVAVPVSAEEAGAVGCAPLVRRALPLKHQG